jgi:hypothetical protein
MITEDVVVHSSDGWVALTMTGTVVRIIAIKGSDLNVRFGSGGTSDGMILYPGDKLSANETIYVRSKKPYVASVPCLVTVAKD